MVVDSAGAVVEPAEAFLAHLSATERSPNTARAYAFDPRDFFVFLSQRGTCWQEVTVEVLGRFTAWLWLPPSARDGSVVPLPPVLSSGLSAATVNRKLAAVSSFFVFHERRGVVVSKGLTRWSADRSGGLGGRSWRTWASHRAR